MKDLILDNLGSYQGLSFSIIILNNIVAFICAFFIMFAYKVTYSGAVYSRKFNVSLGMMVIITTNIMSVISDNIALSLAMVGALSIIRFRTAIKDIRDTTFIFWAIAMGVCCGISQYFVIVIGAIFVFIFLIITRQVIPDNRKLLVVRGDITKQNSIEGVIDTYFKEGAHQIVKSASGESFENVYGITSKVIDVSQKRNAIDIIQRLMRCEGVHSANIVEQTDDIGR